MNDKEKLDTICELFKQYRSLQQELIKIRTNPKKSSKNAAAGVAKTHEINTHLKMMDERVKEFQA